MKIVFLIITGLYALMSLADIKSKDIKYLVATILMAILTLVAYRIG